MKKRPGKHSSDITGDRKKSAKQQREAGAQTGAFVAETVPPPVLGLYASCIEANSHRQKPWRAFDQLPAISAVLESQGKAYTRGFSETISRIWSVCRYIHFFRTLEIGLRDGHHWAREFSTPELVEKMNTLASKRNPKLTPNKWDRHGPCSAAHRFLIDLMAEDEFPIDSEIFCDFWQPFVEEPMEQLVIRLRESIHPFILHKLEDGNYIEAFIGGALIAIHDWDELGELR